MTTQTAKRRRLLLGFVVAVFITCGAVPASAGDQPTSYSQPAPVETWTTERCVPTCVVPASGPSKDVWIIGVRAMHPGLTIAQANDIWANHPWWKRHLVWRRTITSSGGLIRNPAADPSAQVSGNCWVQTRVAHRGFFSEVIFASYLKQSWHFDGREVSNVGTETWTDTTDWNAGLYVYDSVDKSSTWHQRGTSPHAIHVTHATFNWHSQPGKWGPFDLNARLKIEKAFNGWAETFNTSSRPCWEFD